MVSVGFHGNDDRIKESFAKIKTHKHKGVRRPHRPLLLMLMLGHYWNNGDRLVLFRNAAIPLWGLLNKFANSDEALPPVRALYPFATMETETSIWERTHPEISRLQYKAAFAANMKGGFVQPLYQRVINDKPFLLELAVLLHKRHLSYIEDFGELLEAVNIPNRALGQAGHLDKDAYSSDELPPGSSCAVCSYRGLVDNQLVGLRKTHVKWPEAGGPENAPNNILVMCEQHKALFDCGVFTLRQASGGLDIKVSRSYKGPFVAKDGLKVQGGQKSLWPRNTIKPDYVRWHNRVVYSSS